MSKFIYEGSIILLPKQLKFHKTKKPYKSVSLLNIEAITILNKI